MLKKLEKILLNKVESGKELELWFSLDAKTELLKLQYNPPLLLSSSNNSEDMKEIERKLRMSLIKET